MSRADGWYVSIAAVATAFAFRHLSNKKAKAIVVAAVGTPLGILGGLVGANVFAAVLSATDNGLLWFPHEHLPLLLYVPVSYISLFSIHLMLTHFLSPVERTQLEVTHYYIQLLLSSWYMLLLQSFRVRSAYLYAMITALLLVGAVGNELGRMGRRGLWEGMSFKMTYLVPSACLMALAVEAVTTVGKSISNTIMNSDTDTNYRRWTSSRLLQVVWVKKPQPNTSWPLSLSFAALSSSPQFFPCSTAYLA